MVLNCISIISWTVQDIKDKHIINFKTLICFSAKHLFYKHDVKLMQLSVIFNEIFEPLDSTESNLKFALQPVQSVVQWWRGGGVQGVPLSTRGSREVDWLVGRPDLLSGTQLVHFTVDTYEISRNLTSRCQPAPHSSAVIKCKLDWNNSWLEIMQELFVLYQTTLIPL